MTRFSRWLWCAALALSHLACAAAAYGAGRLESGAAAGYSAPAAAGLLEGLPYLIAAMVLAAIALAVQKKR